MKKSILIILVAVACLSSCKTTMYTAREVDVNKCNISMTPMVVDVRPDFTRRITKVSNYCRTYDEAVQSARYLAITENKIDVVVDPILQVEQKSIGTKPYRATLTGYAGFYENVRTIYEDIDTLKSRSREDIEKYLILHRPEVLKYMNAEGKIVNIYHGSDVKIEGCAKKGNEKLIGNDAKKVDEDPISTHKKRK